MVNVCESRGQGDLNGSAIVHKSCDWLFMFAYLHTSICSFHTNSCKILKVAPIFNCFKDHLSTNISAALQGTVTVESYEIFKF